MKAESKDGHDGIGSFALRDIMCSFDADFLAEDHCRAWIMGILHQDKSRCPECGADIFRRLLPSFWMGKRIRCRNCGKYFTALTGTFLSGCHFDFREIILLAFMLAVSVDDKQIAATLKISAESVRLWRHRFEAIEQSKQIGSGD
jgi:transposase-like protein